jgi:integrase
MNRTLGRFSKQAFGITAPILRRMLEATGDDLRGLRNRALLMIAYDSLCRRSELVSLRVEDIQCYPKQNGARVRLRKSKTDQELLGAWIQISSNTHAALLNWLYAAGINQGLIFRGVLPSKIVSDGIRPAQINRIYKNLAKFALLEEGQIANISGHSFRVGKAQDLVKSGASLPFIMNQGRWSKADTAIKYTEATYFS